MSNNIKLNNIIKITEKEYKEIIKKYIKGDKYKVNFVLLGQAICTIYNKEKQKQILSFQVKAIYF
ncbi:hypothetical protein [Mycoplasma phocimorsus]|uniref:hypothetical protein n=1 Tax=Mycoplasma phocimorsus TaxID=3045839 RepID=UPI0024BF8F25|nr:hypothetical protein [Mycoplasma phocimorsus]MDJ1647229.1 hypothetical protein [Mycoplasma phocimorsus]